VGVEFVDMERVLALVGENKFLQGYKPKSSAIFAAGLKPYPSQD
jgi:hypothetical protein